MNSPLSRRKFVGLTGAVSASWSLGAARLGAARDDDRLRAAAENASGRMARQVAAGEVSAAALLVRRGKFEWARAHGRATVSTPFLIASPTKPMTVSAVLLLRDRGRLSLEDRVSRHLPAFRGGDRDKVTLRHLLTHTSGLPDMLPENVELRRRHAPLAEFVERTCRTPLLFPPGERVSYQSMGILLAAAIVETVSGRPLPDFLRDEIFGPLGMARASLGLGGRAIADTAQCQVAEADRSDWDWNSAYWRNLGAPWGGAHATVHDLAAFLGAFAGAGAGPWKPETRREMITTQTGTLRPAYGFGWVREPGAFGRACSPATYGHYGSTGTVYWHDPHTGVSCVLLTTLAAEQSKKSLLVPVCDDVAGGAPA